MRDTEPLADILPPIPTEGGYGEHDPLLVPPDVRVGKTALNLLAFYLQSLDRMPTSLDFDEMALSVAEALAKDQWRQIVWTPACLEAARLALRHHVSLQESEPSKIFGIEMLEFMLYACAHLRAGATATKRLAWATWIEETLRRDGAG